MPGPGPEPPTRDAILSAIGSFQGLTVATRQYGELPWFDPFLGSLGQLEDRQAVYAAKRAAGQHRLTLAVSYAYRADKGRNAYADIPGRDFSRDLPALHGLMEEAIRAGFVIDLRCAGDGQSREDGYNDPMGDTYGHQWLMTNIARIHAALADLDAYTIWGPGFDGVWSKEYPWTPDQVRAWWLLMRSLVGPAGYVSIEWGAGVCHLGDSGQTYTSEAGQCLDVIYQEFPYPLESDMGATWQIGARLLGPAYRWPADQPEDSDTHMPPWYLERGTPRGAYYVHADEFDTYGWVRQRCSLADIQRHRSYLASVGFRCVG
jgi:hypothetical protein